VRSRLPLGNYVRAGIREALGRSGIFQSRKGFAGKRPLFLTKDANPDTKVDSVY
jgi:hypothetical protein